MMRTPDVKNSFDAGQAAFPLRELSFASFAEQAARYTPEDRPEADLDIYLAVACTLGVTGAAEALVRRHGRSIRQALARMKLDGDRHDEAWATALRVVFVGEGSGPAIAGYRGRGSLDGWLRVTATRAAHRVLRRQAPTPTDDLEGEWPSEVWRPAERQLLVTECEEPFAEAMRAGIAALSPEDRRALRSHYRDGLSIDMLAESWAIHRATAARRIARARRRLREHVLRALEGRLGLSESSAVQLVRQVQSQLELADGLLRNTDGEE
jgi:RNA polymerase sigma-70 factor, ECF subfamily